MHIILKNSIFQPFWPTGSGCARGFLGACDAAWMIKHWSSGKMTTLQVLAERESTFQLLSQTTPENLARNYNLYTIDPNTRYRKVPKFSDAKKLCCNLPKIQTKRPNLTVLCEKDGNGIANSEDPDQAAPLGAV